MKAKEEGKDGLILLAGNQLTLGITLPFVDIVFLFTDAVSSDKIVQMMYRCMTERVRSVENDKINKRTYSDIDYSDDETTYDSPLSMEGV